MSPAKENTVNTNAQPILEVKNLKTHFFTDKGVVQAVKGVSFTLEHGKTLGIVGESGCGKSVTASSIMQLIKSPPGEIAGGEIIFRRQKRRAETIDIVQLDPKGMEMRSIRGGEISMIFQEPMTSLNPLHTVGRQIAEVVELHQGLGRKESLKVAIDMLDRVRIADPSERVKQYPHQLSGGMRQRVMIALALSCNPSILIADEPTTALDVTIQAQIIDLMEKPCKRTSARPSSSSPTIWAWFRRWLIMWRSCISGASSNTAAPLIFSAIRSIPTRSVCCNRFRSWAGAKRFWCRLKASCPMRQPR